MMQAVKCIHGLKSAPCVAVNDPGDAPFAEDLIWHASDSRTVTPIVGNAAIERVAQPTWDAALLPFTQLVRQPVA
jgi:hypothetical protein